MEKCLIFARYNEDITWSNIYSGNRIIYNKGLDNINSKLLIPGDEYNLLPNVGRESDTFLYYIINNYYNLPKYVAFTQGSLKDHEWIRKNWGPGMFLNMLDEAKQFGYSQPLISDGGHPDWNLEFNVNQAQTWDPNVNGKYTYIEFLKIIDIYDDFYNDTLNRNIKIYPSAFMVISKNHILSRPKSYYEKIINYCNYHINPIEGHYFERSWPYIFNTHKKLPDITLPTVENENSFNKNILNNTQFYFYIRGHIRNSFKTKRLKEFINLINSNFPNVIFIFQTWTKVHCDPRLTWRFDQKKFNLIKNDIILNERHLKKYFGEINFSSLILDENEISLTGSVEGKLITTPKRGWKNMWYGINKGLEELTNTNIPVFVFRYDYFELDDIFKNGNELEIIEFIKHNITKKTISFTKNEGPGSDNIFCGPLNKIKILTKNFNYNLDSIISYDFKARRHENLVNQVAKLIN